MSSTHQLREKFRSVFNESYNFLNNQQRQAVDQIDGPVMVIAGPGTGKTQILAVRIGNILLHQDVQAHNILCLTFTDAATVAMRKRLVEIIGPEGHKVHIYTFHGFCNQVIQENLGYFGNYRKLDQLSDLEELDVYREIIESLPKAHRLKRPKGDPTYESKRLKNLFAMMKKENLSTDDVEKRVADFIEEKRDSPEFICKRKTTRAGRTFLKGDFRDDKYEEFSQKYDDLLAGAKLFENYKSILKRLGRYDYADMILWVVNAFKENDTLLSIYQERYHYYLVDEYQDTNGAQNDLLYSMIDFMDIMPNVFVVGDDDQAIYKFQGANLNNIKDFKSKYNPEIVVLEKNYRSSQPILDAATTLIDNNLERIIKEDNLLGSKKLIADGPLKELKQAPIIKAYANITHEQADLVNLLTTKYQNGENLDEIAVIYRNHKQVETLVEVLEKRGVPLNIKRRVDILKMPLIKNILNILFYLQSEYENPDSQEDRLFRLMHYHFFNIDSRDIATLAIYKKNLKVEETKSWRDLLGDKKLLQSLNLKSAKAIERLEDKLCKWTADIANLTLQTLFGEIINQGHILQAALRSADKSWKLQVISTLFDLIKDSSKKKPDITLSDFLADIQKMIKADLPLSINKVVSAQDGVHFLTAHSSKGLEFETVYMLSCTKKVWDVNRGNYGSYSYPGNINGDVENNIEDERRLFFVAMTRAKSDLHISYAVKNAEEKDLSKSLFIDEILEGFDLKVLPIIVSAEMVTEYQYEALKTLEKEVQLIEKDKIAEVLKKYKLSVTHLNKYLKCPMTFYFETILRVPTARSKYTGFGNAMHSAFQEYFEKINKNEKVSKETLVDLFKSSMRFYWSHFTEIEKNELTEYGEDILGMYYDKYLTNLDSGNQYFLEEKIDNAEYKGVPIKGVLDRVEVSKEQVEVIDYKTGDGFKPGTKAKLKPPNAKDEKGGDYWRQIVFYKLLLDSDKKHNWNMISGTMDFVEPKRNTSEFTRQKIVVQPHHIDFVGDQILETWRNINDFKFGELCDDEKCYWCNFVREDYVFSGDYEIDSLEESQNF